MDKITYDEQMKQGAKIASLDIPVKDKVLRMARLGLSDFQIGNFLNLAPIDIILMTEEK